MALWELATKLKQKDAEIKLEQTIRDLEYSSSSGSSDIFADYPEVIEARKKFGVQPQFTPDFQETMQKVRNEMNLSLNDLLEEPLLENPRQPELTTKLHEAITPELEDWEQDTEATLDSRVWNLLETHTGSKFHVTPPGYNAFDQQEKHWMEAPEIPWKVLEESREKCKMWLDKQTD